MGYADAPSVAVGARAVWTVNGLGVVRIDPATNIPLTITINGTDRGASPTALAVSDRAVWVANRFIVSGVFASGKRGHRLTHRSADECRRRHHHRRTRAVFDRRRGWGRRVANAESTRAHKVVKTIHRRDARRACGRPRHGLGLSRLKSSLTRGAQPPGKRKDAFLLGLAGEREAAASRHHQLEALAVPRAQL